MALVAIDFGTSGTTYAYAFFDSKEDIILGKWNIPEIKNSTEIILSKNNYEIKKFGNECKKFFLDQSSLKEEFYHFKDIKMKLYENQTEIKATNGKISLKLEFVISKILIYIKEEAIKAIKAVRPLIEEREIEWKVTVPAIWNNKSKEIMLNAAKKANIFTEDNELCFLALEPEAAACDYTNEGTSDRNAIKPGKVYIICDIGGGTIDISTHKRIISNGEMHIEEVYPPSGGNFGSTYINKNFFEKVIKKIFGDIAIKKLEEKINNPKKNEIIYEDYIELLNDIEEFKKDISVNVENDAKRINCSLFEELIDNNISNLIENYNDNCPLGWEIRKYNGFRIHFPYQIMIDITKEILVNNVVRHLHKIMKDVSNVESIIYAGSVSSNDYILLMIKNALPDNIMHYRSAYPSTAVVKGAVIFGFNPFSIKTRISKYTIGISVREKWNNLIHGFRKDLKFFDEKDKCYYCGKIFSPIILQNQKTKVDESLKKSYELMGPKSEVIFYKTNFNKVTFVDEKYRDSNNNKKRKCIQLCKTFFNVGDLYDEDEKEVIVELILGGTFVYGKVIYKNYELPVQFDFSREE